MSNVSFKIAQMSEELNGIIARTYAMLDESNYPEVKNTLESELRKLSERTELRIAFVGQYSSGKSTIISALTGNKDIKISANVETDTVSEYRWNNIVLLDTPGILAGKVEQHDERTKEALKKCDLIVYVLTSSLFDDVIFENFIDLAYRQQFSDKMLIAINKMSKEHGDFNVLSDNYMQSIKSIFSERGYDFNFPVVFIDAKDYIEGTEDDDEEFIQLSNFKSFINQLNCFVEERGLIKKQFDTPVRILKDNISDVTISEVDPHLLDIYKQYIDRIKKCRRDIEFGTRQLADQFEMEAVSKANEVSALIGQVKKEELEAKSRALSSGINALITNFTNDVEREANENYSSLMNEMTESTNKDTTVMYIKHIDSQIASPNISDQERSNLEVQKKFLETLSKGGNKISSMSNVTTWDGVAQASGSQMHTIVYSVGKFFGHNFKPWEAVNTAAKIGKIGRFGVPVVATTLSVALELKQNHDNNKRLVEIQKAKEQFDAEIRANIRSIRRDLESEVRNSILSNYDDKIDELNQLKLELGKTAANNKSVQEKVQALMTMYDYFLSRINSQNDVDEQVQPEYQ